MNQYWEREDKQMLLVGHRGVKALAPENTMESFRLALDYGLDGIETDVWMTKDGELVLIHDESVDRTTNGTGLVRDMTYPELGRLDAGSYFDKAFSGAKIPLLDELFDLVRGRDTLLNIEVKDERFETLEKVMNLIDAHGLFDRIVIASFNPSVTSRAAEQYGVKTQGFPPALYKAAWHDGIYDKMYAVGIPMALLTGELVADYRTRGIKPWCWCPDTKDAVRQAIACGAVLATVNDPRPALAIRQEVHE